MSDKPDQMAGLADELHRLATDLPSFAMACAPMRETQDAMFKGAGVLRSHTALRLAVRDLAEALEECAEDLESFVEDHYANVKQYPGERRRYERDIASAKAARAALTQHSAAVTAARTCKKCGDQRVIDTVGGEQPCPDCKPSPAEFTAVMAARRER